MQASGSSPALGSATVRLKLTMRILEYHTFERDVNAAEFERERNEGDVMDWLEKQFQDDPMPDSGINTESVELDGWSIIKPNRERTDRRGSVA